ncbi:hypothetical protein DAI22_01g385100 [Oryza sativa Japonica Group]|nr:hypothetical protein DAI22_01g385100 [Oryza sativa Japonica Group]
MDQIKGTETNQLHQSEEQINQMDLKDKVEDGNYLGTSKSKKTGTSEVSKEQKISKISKGSTSAPESAKRKITTVEVSKEQKISKISKGSTSAPESAKRKITTVAGQDKALIESYNKEIVDKHNTSNESDLVQKEMDKYQKQNSNHYGYPLYDELALWQQDNMSYTGVNDQIW